MSGLVEGVRKVFDGVVHVVKKIIKPVLIAAAVYFSAGLALAAFPATAGFAASMPLFAGGGTAGLGIGAGATAGTGIFSQAAVAIGMGGGLAEASLAAGTSSGAMASAVGVQATNAALTANAVAAGTAGGAELAALTGAGTAAGGAAAGMSLTDKLLLASMGTKAVGAFLAPSTDEVYEAQRKWRGAFYGVEGDGPNRPGSAPQQTPQPKALMPSASTEQTFVPPKNPATPEPIAPQTPQRQMATPVQPQPQAAPQPKRLMGADEPVENEPITLKKPQAPGVRYVG